MGLSFLMTAESILLITSSHAPPSVRSSPPDPHQHSRRRLLSCTLLSLRRLADQSYSTPCWRLVVGMSTKKREISARRFRNGEPIVFRIAPRCAHWAWRLSGSGYHPRMREGSPAFFFPRRARNPSFSPAALAFYCRVAALAWITPVIHGVIRVFIVEINTSIRGYKMHPPAPPDTPSIFKFRVRSPHSKKVSPLRVEF